MDPGLRSARTPNKSKPEDSSDAFSPLREIDLGNYWRLHWNGGMDGDAHLSAHFIQSSF